MTRASRSPGHPRPLLVVLVLALAVTAGCAGIGELPTGDSEDGGTQEYAGSPRDRQQDRDDAEERRQGSDPDVGGGRYRDPLASPRRMVPSERGWREVFRDDFETFDTDVWTAYDGVPGCCPAGRWDPSMVRVEDSSLFLDTARVDGEWLSGGVGSWDSPLEQQYGRWDIRIRTDADSLGVTVAALLWPADDEWPPEIDFYEIFETEPDRRELTITNHYGAIEEDGTHDATRRPVRADFTRWREMSLRWTPDEIQVLMDGRAVESIRNEGQIPDVTMWLAMQTAVKPVAGQDPTFSGSRSMQVDWVRAYEPA